jgi:hypothetical protein
MAFNIFGYTGTIWAAIKVALAYTTANLNTTTPAASVSLIEAMTVTLKNGLDAIESNQFSVASSQNYTALASLPAMGLTLDPITMAFMLNRLNALQSVTLSAANLVVTPGIASSALPSGQPSIPDPLYLEWLMNYAFETPPAGLTAANFNSQALAAATCWATVANAVQTQPVVYSGLTLSAVLQMGQAAEVVAGIVANLPLMPATTSLSQAWNLLVSMPTLTRYASMLYNDPTSAASQQTSIIRCVILGLLKQFGQLLISIDDSSNTDVRLVTVRVGDSLMDIAARELGNFEQWYEIAQVNGLQPPFIGPTPAPGIASPGQQLFLPTPTTTTPQGPVPSYLINYLGVDIYLGPLNQDMLPWSGDYPTIAGYQNLTFSLGRRLQTTLGGLIYHLNFGSRVPPEVGTIDSGAESGHIQAYTESALLSDPRVNSIISCTVTSLPNYLIAVQSTVQPNGLGAASATVNEVLGPG